ncbi:MAG: hypothetical protein DCF15_01455 [Phormidesmis priestleyi]|uniref:Uncharacterized protein n=1 Tax=Phormidesmis priestleyi TaxID=268141 RepID=A0A2W4XTK7_9CYAN|nr:MAG: hypothetical protein DCF15_01455 [Phormidesmis priestleyi]
MKITDIVYVRKQGYPLLKMTIDGISTVVSSEQKALLIRAGIVCVGSALADKLLVEFRSYSRSNPCQD